MKSGRASMTCGPVPTCSEAANTIPKSPFLGLGPLVLEARVLRETPQGSYPQGGCGRSKDGFAGSDRVEVAESGLATHCAGLNHRGGCAGGDASLEVALVAGGLAPDSDPESPSLAKPGSGRVSMPVVRCSPEACRSGDRGVQSGTGAPEAPVRRTRPSKPQLSGFLAAKY